MKWSPQAIRELLEDGSANEILSAFYMDFALFLKAVYPQRFKHEFSDQHNDAFDLLMDRSVNRKAILAHRDWGKTSLVQLGYASYKILFNETHYFVPVSASESQALSQSESLKTHMRDNPVIAALWSDVSPKDRDLPMTKGAWSVQIQGGNDYCIVTPRGAGQQLRGSLHGDYRPDLIIGDDLEDPKNMKTPEIRQERKEWFFSTLEDMVDYGEDFEFIYISNAVHHDALIWELIEDQVYWRSIVISLCDDNYKTLWPSRFPQPLVDKLVDYKRRHGKLDAFYREHMCKKVSLEGAAFSTSMFKYFERDLDFTDRRRFENIILIDPANTANVSNAETGFVIFSFDLTQPDRYRIPLAYGKRLSVNAIIEHGFQLAAMYNCALFCIETTGKDDWVRSPTETYASLHNISMQFVWLHASNHYGTKEKRVGWLAPYYQSGLIEHHPENCKELESQLVEFPYAKRWDVMDAAAWINYIIQEKSQLLRSCDPDSDVEQRLEDAINRELEEEESYIQEDLGDSWDYFRE